MKLIFAAAVLLVSQLGLAKIVTKDVSYKQSDADLQGYVAYRETSGKRPGILIVHDWMGVNDYVKSRAKQLAEMGYVAFVADIYGKGVRPKDSKEASEQAGKFKGDRPLLQQRVKAAADELAKHPNYSAHKMVAIGYCFGGTTVLELARSGYGVNGVVSFHGGLATPNPAKSLKSKVLVLHGADDPYVPEDEVKAFQKEMRDAHADWQMIYYANAVHAFTVPGAGNDNSKGAAYNELADKRSFEHMKDFLKEVL